MYPFGSGQNNPPFGSGYPPNGPPSSGQPPYPSAPFGAGAPYPPQSSPYPPQSNPGYPPASNSGYPPASNPGYPPASSPGYPPASNPGYPPASNPGYPPASNPGYPPASNPGYPPVSHSSPYPNSSYPGQNPGYPPASYPSMGGIVSAGGYPPQTNSSPYPPGPGGSPMGGYGNGGGGVPFGAGGPAGYQMPGGPSSAYTATGPYPTPMHSGGGGGYPTGSEPVQQQHQQYNYNAPPTKSKGTPTVRPLANFDANSDAQVLRKAMKGFGTDEDALINVICRRSNEQRQLISRAYKTNFGKDLLEDLKSECSGNFEKLMIALMTPIVDFYAKELHDAMSGAGTDEDVLIEVLATMSNYEIHTIKNAYERKYGKSLENEIISETSGNFKRLLVSLAVGARDESGVTDVMAAQRDATELLKAGELQVGTDESTFNMVLCQRNYQQLKLVCDEYAKMTGHTLEKAIQKEFSGDIKEGLMAILETVNNKHSFFAERLKRSMAGMGTNDAQLIRIIVTRSEVDLMDIKTSFEVMFGKSLKSWIKGDTSGHYKHALYTLIAEERSG